MGANTGCKTNLVRSHVLDVMDDRYILTLGTKVSKKELSLPDAPSNVPVHVDLLVWDIMSHRGFRELLRDAYFHGTKGIVAVSDMTRRRTLEDIGFWIDEVQRVAGPVPVVVIGANHDKKDRLEVSQEEVARAARDHGAACFFASESSDAGVEEALRGIAEATLRPLFAPRPADSRR